MESISFGAGHALRERQLLRIQQTVNNATVCEHSGHLDCQAEIILGYYCVIGSAEGFLNDLFRNMFLGGKTRNVMQQYSYNEPKKVKCQKCGMERYPPREKIIGSTDYVGFHRLTFPEKLKFIIDALCELDQSSSKTIHTQHKNIQKVLFKMNDIRKLVFHFGDIRRLEDNKRVEGVWTPNTIEQSNLAALLTKDKFNEAIKRKDNFIESLSQIIQETNIENKEQYLRIIKAV